MPLRNPTAPATPRRRAAVVLVSLVLALAAMVSTGPSAFAAGDGDPRQSGCDASGINLTTAQMPGGEFTIRDPANGAVAGHGYLRYSTSCQSEWVKVTYNTGYLPDQASLWLQNQSGTDLYNSGYAPWGGTIWTWMYRNMRTRVGCGGVRMYRATQGGGYGSYLGWFYFGCA
ncbi:hypothetical protein ABT160_33480 [Streptomyces sp. NPDC001941]|uniref:hypothetical protein n=1 Tax=Streptomyces sp. NPDC001941 TaxID=3154659 RepID=UPI00331A424D